MKTIEQSVPTHRNCHICIVKPHQAAKSAFMATIPKGGGDMRRQQPQARRQRAADDTTPTAEDNLMYLLYELERAVEQPTINWSDELAANVQRRLESLGGAIRRIGRRLG